MEHEPLLSEGFHILSVDSLREAFDNSFPDSETRRNLTNNLEMYLGQLSEIGIPIEVWIDGSYTTTKDNPNDVDLVVSLSNEDIMFLSSNVLHKIEFLCDNNQMKALYNIDTYVFEASSSDWKHYWTNLYGTARDDKTPKGIAVIRLNYE